MEKDLVLKILWLNEVNSTQTYLLERLKSGELQTPIAVVSKKQNRGKGSRNNEWIGLDGNLFLSFAVAKVSLPDDLKLESTSIYLSMLLKELLNQLGSKVWLKWPNDFYLKDKKIGGTITNIYQDSVVCGIGLNIKLAPEDSDKLDIDVVIDIFLHQYFNFLKSSPSWKQIFSKFELEFDKSRKYFAHINGKNISLEAVTLQSDGSVEYNGEKVYSLR